MICCQIVLLSVPAFDKSLKSDRGVLSSGRRRRDISCVYLIAVVSGEACKQKGHHWQIGLFIIRGWRACTPLYTLPYQGGHILWRWWRWKGRLDKIVKKWNEERINDNIKLIPPIDIHKNIVCLLCLINFSVTCWVFLRAISLWNPKKTWNLFSDWSFYTI